MESGQRCRRCLLRDAFPQDYEKYVAGLLRAIVPALKADDETYSRRLALCAACDQLQNGTCMGCGCLVELRAAYRKEKCPFRIW